MENAAKVVWQIFEKNKTPIATTSGLRASNTVTSDSDFSDVLLEVLLLADKEVGARMIFKETNAVSFIESLLHYLKF